MPDSKWNVKRGLNRLFVVSAVCWYIAAGFVLWPKWAAASRSPAQDAAATSEVSNTPTPPPGFTLDSPTPGKRHQPDELDQLLAEVKRTPSRPVGITLAFLFAPPAVYALALALLWIARGFHVEPDARR